MVELLVLTRGNECVGFDRARLEAMRLDLGPEMTRTVVNRALNEIGIRIGEITLGYRSSDMHAILRATRRLMRMANHVGMRRLARVAGDVAHCARQWDTVALAATCARLARLHDRAMVDIRTAAGRSG